MKIRISILHRDDESLISDEYEMDSAEYDALSYPEDMLHAKIWELRNKVTNELIRRHRSNLTKTIDSGSNTVQNTEE